MKKRIVISVFSGILFVAMLVIFTSLEASAVNIAGVDVPQTVTVKNQELVLNGAGIRKKLFIKVYVGALYLPAKRSTVEEILADPGPKRISMNFLYKEVSAKKLVAAWDEGFEDNTSAKQMKSIRKRVDEFNALFSTVHQGDEILLDYLPGEGTQVSLNGELKGSVPGEDFNQALLKIWLGDEPADDDLKDAMLGK